MSESPKRIMLHFLFISFVLIFATDVDSMNGYGAKDFYVIKPCRMEHVRAKNYHVKSGFASSLALSPPSLF